jgi:hypothetical protein
VRLLCQRLALLRADTCETAEQNINGSATVSSSGDRWTGKLSLERQQEEPRGAKKIDCPGLDSRALFGSQDPPPHVTSSKRPDWTALPCHTHGLDYAVSLRANLSSRTTGAHCFCARQDRRGTRRITFVIGTERPLTVSRRWTANRGV